MAKLTEVQRRRLHILEPQLLKASRLGDYETAEIVMKEIQIMLSSTEHSARLLKNKNWFFETALESGRVDLAIRGFEGIRKKSNKQTRNYLEATSFLAIAYIRKQKFEEAKEYITEALKSKSIQSKQRRMRFRKKLIERFEEETLLANLSGYEEKYLDEDEVYSQYVTAVQQSNIDEMYWKIGELVPREDSDLVQSIRDFAKSQLPYDERKMLPESQKQTEAIKVGQKFFRVVGKQVWKSICEPECNVYKLWNKGLEQFYSSNVIILQIISVVKCYKIALVTLVAQLAAIIMKLGLNVFCDMMKPSNLMEERLKRS